MSGQLRAVTVQNRIANVTSSNATRANFGTRWHHTIGSGAVTKIILTMNHWAGASGGTVINPGNTATINGMSVEFNGVIVPVTWGGQTSITMADGQSDVQSDPIWPSQFGVARFNVGDTFWTKLLGSVPAINNKICISPRSTSDLTGCQVFWYNAGETTVSSVNSPDVFTSTGVALSSTTVGLSPLVLGTFESGDPAVWYAHGDSKTSGTGETGNNKNGRGWFLRAMADEDGVSNPRASLNFAVHGSASALALQALPQSFYKYANRGVIYYGTNDFGASGTGITVANMNARVATIAANMRAQGITKVAGMKLAPRADSTDLWVTEINQTPLAGWGAGSLPDQFNGGLGALGLDAVFTTDAIRAQSNPYVFIANGTARYAAFDNTHPSTGGAILIANSNRVQISQLSAQPVVAPADDATPDAATFGVVTGAEKSALVALPTTVTISGITAGVSVVATPAPGTSYRISTDNGAAYGAWTSSQTSLQLGYRVQARAQSSALPSASVTATVTIGGIVFSGTITTAAPEVVVPKNPKPYNGKGKISSEQHLSFTTATNTVLVNSDYAFTQITLNGRDTGVVTARYRPVLANNSQASFVDDDFESISLGSINLADNPRKRTFTVENKRLSAIRFTDAGAGPVNCHITQWGRVTG